MSEALRPLRLLVRRESREILALVFLYKERGMPPPRSNPAPTHCQARLERASLLYPAQAGLPLPLLTDAQTPHPQRLGFFKYKRFTRSEANQEKNIALLFQIVLVSQS